MTVRNGMPYVTEAVGSVLAQTLRDLEIVVVDNGSTDGSLEAARASGDARITAVPLGRNIGRTPALNVALHKARGRYIAILDADDVAYPARLERQAAHLDAHPEVTLVAGRFDWWEVGVGVIEVEPPPLSDVEIAWRLVFTNPLAHSSVMMRRDVVQSLRGYDEQFEYAQDYALYSAMMRKGYRLACLPMRVAAVRFWSGSASHTFGEPTRTEPVRIAAHNLSHFLPELSSPEIERVADAVIRDGDADADSTIELAVEALARICAAIAERQPVERRGLEAVHADAARRIAQLGWRRRTGRGAAAAERRILGLGVGQASERVPEGLMEARLGLALRAVLHGDRQEFLGHLGGWAALVSRNGRALLATREGAARLLAKSVVAAWARRWWLSALGCAALAFVLRPIVALSRASHYVGGRGLQAR